MIGLVCCSDRNRVHRERRNVRRHLGGSCATHPRNGRILRRRSLCRWIPSKLHHFIIMSKNTIFFKLFSCPILFLSCVSFSSDDFMFHSLSQVLFLFTHTRSRVLSTLSAKYSLSRVAFHYDVTVSTCAAAVIDTWARVQQLLLSREHVCSSCYCHRDHVCSFWYQWILVAVYSVNG